MGGSVATSGLRGERCSDLQPLRRAVSGLFGERSDLQPLRRAVSGLFGERSDLQPLRRAV
jgi:hypothetical protein